MWRSILWTILLLLTACAQSFDYERVTWDDERWGEIVQQGLDNSCGFASLLTVMKYHYGDERYDEKSLIGLYVTKASEKDLARAMKDGVSLLELEKLVQGVGYVTNRQLLTLPQLEQIVSFVPVLVYLEIGTYKHFAVVRGISADTVWLADPSRGNVYHRKEDFLAEWKAPASLKGPQSLPGGLIILRKGGKHALKLLRDPSEGLPEVLHQLKRELILKNGS